MGVKKNTFIVAPACEAGRITILATHAACSQQGYTCTHAVCCQQGNLQRGSDWHRKVKLESSFLRYI